jgi:hypothetical protein
VERLAPRIVPGADDRRRFPGTHRPPRASAQEPLAILCGQVTLGHATFPIPVDGWVAAIAGGLATVTLAGQAPQRRATSPQTLVRIFE